jgi:hypothetical protein
MMVGGRRPGSKLPHQSTSCGRPASRWALAAASVCVVASLCGADMALAQRMMMEGGSRGYGGGDMHTGGDMRPGGMRSRGGFGGGRFGIGLGIGILSGIAAGTPAAGSAPPRGGDVVVTRAARAMRAGPPSSGPSPSRSSRRGGSGVPPADERRYVPDEVIVELAGNPSNQTFNTLAARHRLARIDSQRIALTDSTWVRWRIADRRSVPAVIRALEADGSIRSAQPNYLFVLQEVIHARKGDQAGAEAGEQAGDPIQYALAKLHLPEAQAVARGRRVVVAVIDTEIDTTHPELAGAIADTFDALGSPAPMEAHGTGIAGTIAAHARLLGAAPDVRILAVRALGGGQGSTFSIVKGLDWAVAHDAKIINMSFAGPSDPGLARAIAAAHDKGRILVAAAGNKGPKSPPLYPAADPNVIAVTATDANDRLFEAANRGNHVAIAAPGVDILVPAPGNIYVMSSGTSFASAFVSGVAALMAERKPDLSPDAAKNVLMSTAHDLGPKGRDDQFGAGLMDANQAILALTGRPAADLSRGLSH